MEKKYEMLNVISHRRNSIEELLMTPSTFGVEVDLRWSRDDGIYLAHDPGSRGVSFEPWLKHFKHQTLILNVKEDGLEGEILDSLEKFEVHDFFFLDQPFPTLLKSLKMDIPCAVRISEHETIPTNLPETPSWIWADSFTGDWSHLIPHLENLEKSNSYICLVSPELQGRQSTEELSTITKIVKPYEKLKKLSVCTKFPEVWASYE